MPLLLHVTQYRLASLNCSIFRTASALKPDVRALDALNRKERANLRFYCAAYKNIPGIKFQKSVIALRNCQGMRLNKLCICTPPITVDNSNENCKTIYWIIGNLHQRQPAVMDVTKAIFAWRCVYTHDPPF